MLSCRSSVSNRSLTAFTLLFTTGYHRLEHLFARHRDRLPPVAVDETKLDIEDDEVYVWIAVDVEMFETLHIEVSPRRSNLDALLVLREALQYCSG
jgi:putative transposase